MRAMGRLSIAVFTLMIGFAGCAPNDAPVDWTSTMQHTSDGLLFISVHAVSDDIVWAGGSRGTIALTTNGGESWSLVTVPGADSLQFRDVHGFDGSVAFGLTVGPGEASRIYKTVDGGRTWALQFMNDDPQAFFDCMDFWDNRNGIAFSDAVGGRFVLVRTEDGENWSRVPTAPESLEGEGSFAASGTCLRVDGSDRVVFGTAAASQARVFIGTGRGESWRSSVVPIAAGGGSAGIATISLLGSDTIFAGGGDISEPGVVQDSTGVVSTDGGSSWRRTSALPFPGAIYGSSFAERSLVVNGPGGVAISTDLGMSWTLLDTLNYWGTSFREHKGWTSGTDGKLTAWQSP